MIDWLWNRLTEEDSNEFHFGGRVALVIVGSLLILAVTLGASVLSQLMLEAARDGG